jgi:hypothetical protein
LDFFGVMVEQRLLDVSLSFGLCDWMWACCFAGDGLDGFEDIKNSPWSGLFSDAFCWP